MAFFKDFHKARACLTGAESVATLDYMEDFFGDEGGNWTQEVYSAANGSRCLVGAANHVRVSAVDDAKYWLRQAIAEREPHLRSIEEFNDTRQDFGEIAAVIRRAKELAARARLPVPKPVAALPAPPAAEILPPAQTAEPWPVMRDVTPRPEPQAVRARRPGLFARLLNE